MWFLDIISSWKLIWIVFSKRRLDPMDKLGRWAVCSIDAFLNIHTIETVMLESLDDDYEFVNLFTHFNCLWSFTDLKTTTFSISIYGSHLLNSHRCSRHSWRRPILGKVKLDTPRLLTRYVFNPAFDLLTFQHLLQISKSVMAARQYHTGHIRNEIIGWVDFDNDDPYLPRTPKSLRGINHPATRRLILPQRYVHRMYDEKYACFCLSFHTYMLKYLVLGFLQSLLAVKFASKRLIGPHFCMIPPKSIQMMSSKGCSLAIPCSMWVICLGFLHDVAFLYWLCALSLPS